MASAPPRSAPLTVDVAVPVGLDRSFTYAVPPGRAAPPPGTRVLVPLGARALIGVVRPRPPAPLGERVKLRPLLDVLDLDRPALDPALVGLCEWIIDYYLAPPGEVYRLALPGLLTASDARVASVTPAGQAALANETPLLLDPSQRAQLAAPSPALDRDAARLLAAVADAGPGGCAVAGLARAAGDRRGAGAGVFGRLGALADAGLVALTWDDGEPQGRVDTFARRTDRLRGGGGEPEQLAALLGRSKRRRALLDELEAARADAVGDGDAGWVALRELAGAFPRVRELLGPLVDRGLVALRDAPRSLDPFAAVAASDDPPKALTPEQRLALAAIVERLTAARYASVLLHGVTGSGKTEVYLQAIAHAHAHGGGAIVLVPEIALTPQLADRFRARFGDQVAVLHSGLTPRQRVDAWDALRSGRMRIAVGARSAVFAPVVDLRVIVVDEEHDGSFKQDDGVRYSARDVALVRAREAGAVALLGSATPSLESWQLACDGRHALLQLRERPTPRPLPSVELLPLKLHRPDPASRMSARLRDALMETVAAGEQAIVFLNRRGFTTGLVCEACGARQQCPDCSAPAMTFHLRRHRLECHLCGHTEPAPQRCRHCGQGPLVHEGAGTERVELALTEALPGVRVARLDRDVARGRRMLETLADFRAGRSDVLVGTQMLSKGHDFPGVTLVGVLQGDHGLGLPDPRAAERTFQLLTQVAGRAGRGERPGRVLIQAWDVEHPALVCAAHHDFEGFVAQELRARRDVGNPPFGHLALVRVSGRDPQEVRRRSDALGELLRELASVVQAGSRGGASVGRDGAAEAGEGTDDPRALPAAPADARALGSELGGFAAPLRVLGPTAAAIERIDGKTRWQLLLRARARPALRWVLERLRPRLGLEGSGAALTHATVDVDPLSLV